MILGLDFSILIIKKEYGVCLCVDGWEVSESDGEGEEEEEEEEEAIDK